jgi:DMSO/TMAO reductase YedYZ molybdopterin-dependent catalytic subunit
MWSRNEISKTFVIVVLGISFMHSIWRAETLAGETEFALIVRGGVGRETRLSLSEIGKLPRFSVRAKDEKGKESVWEGVPLHEVLKVAGVKLGEAIRGKTLANYLVAEAADGYRVVFTLPEIDPTFTDLTFLLAYRRDGQPMGLHEGNLRIVVPHEKRHARWIRQVIAVSIRSS